MDNLNDLKDRWKGVLRMKASEYEHAARKKGETVCSPSLDDLANELEAFFTGLTVR